MGVAPGKLYFQTFKRGVLALLHRFEPTGLDHSLASGIEKCDLVAVNRRFAAGGPVDEQVPLSLIHI